MLIDWGDRVGLGRLTFTPGGRALSMSEDVSRKGAKAQREAVEKGETLGNVTKLCGFAAFRLCVRKIIAVKYD